MIYTCLFDSKLDRQAVMPDMSVDLAEAIETGVVLDTGTVAEHNDVDDPSCIYGRVRDCFDAFEAKSRILASAKAAAAKLSAAAATPTATPTAAPTPSE